MSSFISHSETNMKVRQSLSVTSELGYPNNLAQFDGMLFGIECAPVRCESLWEWKWDRISKTKRELSNLVNWSEVGDSSHMTWFESDSSCNFLDLRLTWLDLWKDSTWL